MKKLTNKAGRHKIDLKALKESEARFRSIVLWSPDAIIVTDAKGKIEYMNPAAERVFNRKVESFIGKDFGLPLVDGESTEIDIFRSGKDPGVGDMYVVETEWLNKKAQIITIRDITERKEAEEALKESEARFKAIFNESTDGMLLTEIGTKRFFMCNPKICQMLGYSEEELVRLGVDDIHLEGDLPFVMEQFERQAKGEFKLALGLPVKRKDGSIFYADVNTSPITLSGGKYLLGSFRDITDSQKIQDEIKEKMHDLERFSNFAVDRELKMEELEMKIKELEEKVRAR